MNRIILLLATFFSACLSSFAQTPNSKMLFVIDSIPVIHTPGPMNDLWEEDIASRTVIKNNNDLHLPDAANIDSITYIFTKEYINRPGSIKQTPSLKQMEMKDSVWLLGGIPYTGKYLDYYYSGRKVTEGTLLNGKQDGEEIYYFQNGQVGRINNYKNGKLKGISINYYKNATIRSNGTYNEDGHWKGESYFPNGLTESRSTEKNNDGYDSLINYFVTGKIKQVITFKNKHIITDSNLRKSILINKKIDQMKKAANNKAAKKIAAEVIELDSTNTDVYGNLGFFMMDKNHFNEAIAAFDKALKIEPFLIQLLVYRAFARIKKYESRQVRTITENKQTLFLTSNNRAAMPAAEREKICDDLKRADSLRTIYAYSFDKLLIEISKKYCDMDVRR